MIKKSNLLFFLIFYSWLFPANCTCCVEEQYFNESISYYPFSYFDFNISSNQPLLFKYGLITDGCPENIVIEIDYSIFSPNIGINSYQSFYKGEISQDKLNPLKYFTNNDIESASSQKKIIGNDKLESLYSFLSKSSSMPNGKYLINISILSDNITIFNAPSKYFEVDNPSTLEILFPGGPLSDISNSYVFTTNPLFTWYSDYCQLCEYGIRVAEYNKNEHNSLEEALNDRSLIPSNQLEEFKNLGFLVQAFQFPSDNLLPLESDKYYVWQIRRSSNLSLEAQFDFSEIFIFEIRSPDKLVFDDSNTYLSVIKSIIGKEKFNLLFGPGGELEKFVTEGEYIMLNGDKIHIDALYSILSEVNSNKAQFESIEIK